MIALPSGWLAEPGRGWPEIYCIVHEPCGWRSALAYDFERPEDQARIEDIISDHVCEATA